MTQTAWLTLLKRAVIAAVVFLAVRASVSVFFPLTALLGFSLSSSTIVVVGIIYMTLVVLTPLVAVALMLPVVRSGGTSFWATVAGAWAGMGATYGYFMWLAQHSLGVDFGWFVNLAWGAAGGAFIAATWRTKSSRQLVPAKTTRLLDAIAVLAVVVAGGWASGVKAYRGWTNPAYVKIRIPSDATKQHPLGSAPPVEVLSGFGLPFTDDRSRSSPPGKFR